MPGTTRVALLARNYPAGEGVVSEPGLPSPQQPPRGGVLPRLLPREARGALRPAPTSPPRAGLPTTYVFPQRAWSAARLQRGDRGQPRRRHGALPSRLPVPLRRHRRAGGRGVGGGAAPEAGDPRPPPQPGPDAAPRPRPDRGARARCSPRACGDDPDNAEVYQGLDQVLGLLGRPAASASRRSRPILTRIACPAPSCSSAPWLSSRPAGSPKPRLCLPAASSPARSSAPTCGRSGSRCGVQKARGPGPRRRVRRGTERRLESLGREGPASPSPRTASSRSRTAPARSTSRRRPRRLRRCRGSARALGKGRGASGRLSPAECGLRPSGGGTRLGDRADAVRPRVEAALESWANRLVVGHQLPGSERLRPGADAPGARPRGGGAARSSARRCCLPDKVMSHYLSREALAEAGSRNEAQ